jgi:hypothetical protein
MKAKSFALSAAAFALSLASIGTVAKADQWTDADALFVRRAEGPAVIEQARAKYQTILNAAGTAPDAVRAVTQLARLAIYQGEMLLPKSDTSGRIAIFDQCDDFVNKIAPDARIGGAAVGATPQYYFFKGICLGFWGEAAGPVRSLPYVPTLKDCMRQALALDTRFEGGGAHRLVAGIKSNPAARALPGLYDIVEAQSEATAALASAAYPGDANNGRAYYENLRTETQVLVQAGKIPEAKAKMQEAIAIGERAIRNNRLPAGREPESRFVIEKLKIELEQVNRQ